MWTNCPHFQIVVCALFHHIRCVYNIKVLNSRCLIGGCHLFIYLIFLKKNLKSHHSMVVDTEPDIKQSGQLCETPWGPRSSGFTACQLVLVI